MIDWKQAFDRQCPTLGVLGFVENGVRKALVPLLVSYFQDRRMIVKWHGVESSLKMLKGGGPQGGLWGILEYLGQSNNNTTSINPIMSPVDRHLYGVILNMVTEIQFLREP